MPRDNLKAVTDGIARDDERIKNARRLWAPGTLLHQVLLSSAKRGKGVDYWDDPTGQMFSLDAPDVQRLVADGLLGFCRSVEELRDKKAAEALTAILQTESDADVRLEVEALLTRISVRQQQAAPPSAQLAHAAETELKPRSPSEPSEGTQKSGVLSKSARKWWQLWK